MSEYNSCDKSLKCCVTCTYWGGWRQFDGLGRFTWDMANNRDEGICNQVVWKGFGGSKVRAMASCPDYEAMQK